MKKDQNYEFLWSNHQSLMIIEMNLRPLLNLRDIVWNQLDNVIEVSRDNEIDSFHSKKDLEHDVEKGRLFFDKKFPKKFISDVKKHYKNCWKLFDYIKITNFSKLSNEELFGCFMKIVNNWEIMISYFRASQESPIHYLVEELKKDFSEEEISILLLSHELDILDREQIDWQKLLKKDFSKRRLIKHAEKYPWIVACHISNDDVIDTLTQRYDYGKKHFEFKDIKRDKKELRKKQDALLTKSPNSKQIVYLLQKIALSRMQSKSCWAGTDFYSIPLFQEIAIRANEPFIDIYKYYLVDEIKPLLEGRKISDDEKHKRKKCFVALLKDGKLIFKSGDEAEKLAKEELKELYEVKKTDELSGKIAHTGLVVGTARILQSNNIEMAKEFRKTFEKGQILVTQMTQPNIMDIAMKASAIVTDEGGMLSHAAIISRELNIPCIVGTSIATKVIKDGNTIEVDANKGIVKILKKR